METRPRETLTSLAVTTVRSIRQPVASLSGGQRQSVAIAKAVLWNSQLVIMDEPTAALGVAQTAMVLDLVRRLADRGLAVLSISHNMNDVFQVADRIAVLQLGRMVAVRPAAELDRQIVVDLMTTGSVEPVADNGRPTAAHEREATDGQDRRACTVGPDRRRPVTGRRGRAGQADLAVAPESVANSLGEYLRGWLGAGPRRRERCAARRRRPAAHLHPLPDPQPHFLTAGNLVNLLIQGAVYMLLAMAEIFALLLGEIDLSIGFVSGIGGIIAAELVKQHYQWPWWAAIIAGPPRLRRDRGRAGHDHHPHRAAVVRRDPRRPARPAGRDAADARPGRRRCRSTTTSSTTWPAAT